ncbi:photosystem I P700 chlorophyll a apoprotein [Trifolium medium]|uniref:Photosystem I P700 chlorophyll a apoprotein n=1 Tax=Trifolium medium TaxID=97028 RepID=A0A392PIT4_9FABA|nr:photosystem I P700 chlorophyll a apoprotein [Trifolium medium]
MKLQNDDDVRTIFSIFSQYSTKGPIELDTTLVRSIQAICSRLIRLRTFDQIASCMVEFDEDEVDEVVNLSDP